MSGSNEKQPKKKLGLVRENVKTLGVRSGIQTGPMILLDPVANSAIGPLASIPGGGNSVTHQLSGGRQG